MFRSPPWWKNTIIYELYTDKFAANLKGLITKLDYLELLGIDCIWILPHYPSPMIDDGYDVSDFRDVRKELGTLKDFQEVINEAHNRGIKVIIDMILNHTSNQHSWFQEAKKSRSSLKRDYYLWSENGDEYNLADNPFSNIKPNNWIYNTATKDYYYATFYPQQPDLNWQNPKVLEEMLEVIDYWINLGTDGFRLDAISRLTKRESTTCLNLPETHEIIKKIRKHVDEINPNIALLSEDDAPSCWQGAYFGDGNECQMAFHFLSAAKLWLAIKRNDLSIIKEHIEKSYDIPDNCQWVTFLRNHDTIKLDSLEKEEERELVKWLDPGCKFSYDLGDRLAMRVAEIFEGNKDKIINAHRILLEQPGSPVIYYGDEIGMRNESFKTKPKDTRACVRGTFDWNESKKQIDDENSIFNHLSRLIVEKKKLQT